MNILVVYPYLPYPLDRGTFQRTFHLLKALASEHTVDLIALCENGEGAEHRPVFEEFCREVKVVPFTHPAWPKLGLRRLLDLVPVTIRHWESPQLELTLEKALRERKYDMVHVCDIVMAQYFMTRHREIPLSMDRSRVDLQYQVQSTSIMARSWKDRLLSWENITKMWLYEKRAARRVSLEVLCGPDDKTFVRRYVSRSVPVSVVANGVDLEYFKPDAAAEPDVQAVRPTVLFCGAMDYTLTWMPLDGTSGDS
ncbi:glycosyltransferase [Verrucomicrobium spinosum]|uniref:glycosyltransferase n=1 Tax=Verrucomicrobium spinosum TaxID=2736 RepID=UPI00094628DF|nr:glycosyltransferase [Verrucomicrobium spinosum]